MMLALSLLLAQYAFPPATGGPSGVGGVIAQWPAAVCQGLSAGSPFAFPSNLGPDFVCQTTSGVTGGPEIVRGEAIFYESQSCSNGNDTDCRQVQASTHLPTGFSTATLVLRVRATATGQVVFRARSLCLADGDNPSAAAWSAAQDVAVNVTSTTVDFVSADTVLSPAGSCAAGKRLYLSLLRKPNLAGDTGTNDARLLAVVIK